MIHYFIVFLYLLDTVISVIKVKYVINKTQVVNAKYDLLVIASLYLPL